MDKQGFCIGSFMETNDNRRGLIIDTVMLLTEKKLYWQEEGQSLTAVISESGQVLFNLNLTHNQAHTQLLISYVQGIIEGVKEVWQLGQARDFQAPK